MKNLFTLFLISLTLFSFAQQESRALPKTREVKRFTPDSRYHIPTVNHKSGSAARTSGACDTSDVIDYNTYAEIAAINAGLSYTGSLNGSTPQPYVQEVTSSFIDINHADQFLYSYVMAAFDTLVFPNYATFSSTGNLQASVYTKTRKTSTVTLDSVAVVLGIYGDTVSAHGTMANDSIVFKIYAITNGIVGANPVQSIPYVGYSGLSQFLVGPQHITTGIIPVGYTFGVGQGFAIRADYYNSDTSSHCVFAYGQADSCTDLIYNGQSLGFSFAYPSPFIGTASFGGEVGNTFWGEIDSTTPTTATVRPICNGYGYFSIASFPTNCAYVFTQNWQFLPFVTVTNTLGLTINGANPLTLTCPTTAHTITTAKTGDLGGAVYSWSSGQNTPSISLVNPGTYGVTVTNSSGCTASDQLVAAYSNGASISPSFTVPAEICENQPAVFVNTTGVAGYTASWTYGQGVDSVLATTNSTYTYTNVGSYPVNLTLDSAGCKFTAPTQVVTVLNCVGILDVAFDNSISMIPNPSNGNVTLTISGVDNSVNITVYNVIGQTVKTFASTDVANVFNKNLDLNGLSNGTYLVKIQSGNKVATKKLVISK